MKKQRIFAMMTALCCAVGAFSAFPTTVEASSVWGGSYFIVRSGRMSPDNLGIRHLPGGSDYSIGCCADLAAILEGQEDPQYGDILYIDFSGEVVETFPGCMHLKSGDTVTNLGAAESMELTVTANADYALTLEDAASTTYTYHYYYDDMVLERFFDFENMAAGSVVEFAMYEEQPVLPLEIISEETILPVHEFAVMSMNEEKDYYTLCDLATGMPYSFSLSTFQDYGGVGEPKLGDILRMNGYICCTDLWGVNSFFLTTEDAIEVTAGNARIIGNLIDNETLVKKTKTVASIDEVGFVSFGNGTPYYSGYDFQNYINWENIVNGDQISFYTYNNVPVFPVGVVEELDEALTPETYVVIGVDDEEHPNRCVIRTARQSVEFFWLDLADFMLENEEPPKYGDILHFYGEYVAINPMNATNQLEIYDSKWNFLMETNGVIGFRKIGSVYDAANVETFTVKSIGTPVQFQEGCCYYTDALRLQPSGIDWETVKSNDRVTFYTYEGVPMLPTAVSYAGDVNFDNAVTIADVIFLNRQILGDVIATFNQELADFDGNGIVDAADSLMILKRIVELI